MPVQSLKSAMIPPARLASHPRQPAAAQSHVRRNVQALVANPASNSGSSLLSFPRSPPATCAEGLPTINTDSGAAFFTAEDSRPVILFDGACNLCNGGVNLMLDLDTEGLYRYAALQSDAGKALLMRSGRRPDDISSIALVTKDKHWVKSQAVLNIAAKLKMPLPLVSALSQLFHPAIRDVAYDLISENRYKMFGEAPSCRMMQKEWRDRFLV